MRQQGEIVEAIAPIRTVVKSHSMEVVKGPPHSLLSRSEMGVRRRLRPCRMARPRR